MIDPLRYLNPVSAACQPVSVGIASPASGMESGKTLKCVSFMRHSIAEHNEAAAMCPNAMDSVYLNEMYADSRLSARGIALVESAREALAGLKPPPEVVLCSPLTRTIQTAIAMFGGTKVRIVAVPEVREAYGKFPCDRHRDKKDLERTFGDSVDFSLCDTTDKWWTRDHREEMSHLKNRVAGFIERVVRRKETHVFVVSHGVFMETAVRQLASICPGYNNSTRVHNCEVHSFVFSVPATTETSGPTGFSAAGSSSGTEHETSTASPRLCQDQERNGTATGQAVESNAKVTACRGTPIADGSTESWTKRSPPRVEAYLSGRGLALTCASGMPLQEVAHVGRLLRRFAEEGDRVGGIDQGSPTPGLNEARMTTLLGQCGVKAEEARSIFGVLDGGKLGVVLPQDFLSVMMAFYSGDEGTPGGVSTHSGILELRNRYHAEFQGTPLADRETLRRVTLHILEALLSMR